MHAAVLALSVALASACSEESFDAETDPEAPPAKLYFLDSMDDDRFSRITDPPPKSAPVIPPEENNGFSRVETGWPTTDGERLRGFFEREAARRGHD